MTFWASQRMHHTRVWRWRYPWAKHYGVRIIYDFKRRRGGDTSVACGKLEPSCWTCIDEAETCTLCYADMLHRRLVRMMEESRGEKVWNSEEDFLEGGVLVPLT